MQRQSLGSPGSKLQLHGGTGGGAAGEEEKRSAGAGADLAEEEVKAEKQVRPGCARPEQSIHLIPVLTILCLLVLYLCSHDPSPKDLESVDGAARLIAAKAVSGADIGRDIGAERIGVPAVRSRRGLKEAEEERYRRRRNRKLGIL